MCHRPTDSEKSSRSVSLDGWSNMVLFSRIESLFLRESFSGFSGDWAMTHDPKSLKADNAPKLDTAPFIFNLVPSVPRCWNTNWYLIPRNGHYPPCWCIPIDPLILCPLVLSPFLNLWTWGDWETTATTWAPEKGLARVASLMPTCWIGLDLHPWMVAPPNHASVRCLRSEISRIGSSWSSQCTKKPEEQYLQKL